MYNLLIADDEIYVRDRIKDIVESMGLFKVFLAEDGIETLKIVQENQIDALLLDINMPVLNGISVLEEIRRLEMDTMVVIISGYSDFEYARDALKLNAIDYVSKPVVPQKIREILQNLYDRVCHRELERNEYSFLLNQVEQSRDSIRARFFNELLEGNLIDDETLNRAEFLGISIKGTHYCVGIIEIEKNLSDINFHQGAEREKEYQIYLKSVENKITTALDNRNDCLLFQKESGLFAIIACLDDQSFNFSEVLDRIRKVLQIELNFPVSISMGEKITGFEEICISFNQAKKALSYKLLLGNDYVLRVKDLAGREAESPVRIDTEKVELFLKLKQLDEIEACIHNTFDIIRQGKASYSLIHIYILGMKYIICLIEVLQEYNQCNDEEYKLFSELTKHKSLDDMEIWLLELFKQSLNKIENFQIDSMNSAISNVKKYVKNHYKENISLLSISESLNYSANYLGHYFKATNGYSISEYINNVRIGAAKELLKNSELKFYEIAYEVGFNDQNYFFTVFKKVTGLTPKEFRNL